MPRSAQFIRLKSRSKPMGDRSLSELADRLEMLSSEGHIRIQALLEQSEQLLETIERAVKGHSRELDTHNLLSQIRSLMALAEDLEKRRVSSSVMCGLSSPPPWWCAVWLCSSTPFSLVPSTPQLYDTHDVKETLDSLRLECLQRS